MKIVATMPARNEDWILGLSMRAALMWCDQLVINIHASTDNTKKIAYQIAREYGDLGPDPRVTVMVDENPVWEEMRHRQNLLTVARLEDASHIVLVDADEVLTGNLIPVIRDHIEKLPTDGLLQLPWLCLRDSINRFHASGSWAQQFISMAFLDSPHLYWKAQDDGYDLHHRHPMGRYLDPVKPYSLQQGGLMHLQFVSQRRLKAKQALYKINEVLRWPNREPVETVDRRYNLAVYGEGHVMEFANCPSEWWDPYEHLMEHLNPGAEPWQESECRRLVQLHGADRFKGLDLFGVV